jgi:two-component system, chemotaxis family, protein-glutamate methylesterase/glutaminase
MITTPRKPIRVLVTDDTALYRRMLSDMFSKIPGVEVAGTAFDGEDCLSMIERLKPDFVTLDINMPRRDGLATLEEIRRRKVATHVVIVSSPTAESAEQTVRALRNGALDMILKPSGASVEANRKCLEEQLLAQVETVRGLLHRVAPRIHQPTTSVAPGKPNSVAAPKARKRSGPFECLCIGVSTGGPAALGAILPKLPKGLPAPIFIVQHMPPVFTKSMAAHLAQASSIPIIEASHGQTAENGAAYVAPGGKQMRVVKKGLQFEIQITDDPPVAACKPSVDYLFDSVAKACTGNILAMILTGMGNDGLSGCRKLHALGAHILAQSGETCVVYGMPRQIVDNNLADEILPLPGIADRLTQLFKGSHVAAKLR